MGAHKARLPSECIHVRHAHTGTRYGATGTETSVSKGNPYSGVLVSDMSSHLSLSRPFASVSPAIQMLTLLVASSLLAVPVAVSHLDEWRAYSTIFDDVADAPSEFERFVMAMEQSAKLAAGTNVTCADCYKIHGGASGDCSSVFGCNAKLCIAVSSELAI